MPSFGLDCQSYRLINFLWIFWCMIKHAENYLGKCQGTVRNFQNYLQFKRLQIVHALPPPPQSEKKIKFNGHGPEVQYAGILTS